MKAASRPAPLLGAASYRALLALALVLVIGCLFNAHGAFFHWSTHRDMLRQVSVYGILACGMTLVIITGGIDLSVGSLVGLSAVLFALETLHHGRSAPLAILIVLAAGAATGLASGALIARFRLQPFVATLAMMVFARGLAKWIADGQKISGAIQNADGTFTYVDLPPIFHWIDRRILWGNLSVVTLVFLACVLRPGSSSPSSGSAATFSRSAGTRRRPGIRACRSPGEAPRLRPERPLLRRGRNLPGRAGAAG